MIRLLCLIFFFFGTTRIKAVSPQDSSLHHLKEKVIFYVFEMPNHDSAFKFIEEGLSLAKRKNDSGFTALFYSYKGNFYYMTNQNLSLQYLFKAKEIYRSMNDSVNLANIYKAIGAIEQLSRRQKLRFLKEAISIAREINDLDILSQSYGNMGVYYSNLRMPDSALYYYKKYFQVKPPEKYISPSELAFAAGTYNNIGIEYELQKKYEQALHYYYKALSFLPPQNSNGSVYTIQSNLMNVYFKIGIPDSAFHYFDRIKKIFPHRPDLEKDSYSHLSEFYESIGEASKALAYYKKADSIQEVQYQQNKTNALSLLELEYDSRIKKEQLATLNAEITQVRNTRIFLIVGLCLTIFFALILLYQQKQKNRKKREALMQKKQRAEAERKLLASELRHSELRRQYLDDELRFTTKELTSFATNIVQNHSLWDDLQNRVSAISKEKDSKRVQEQLKELSIMLRQFSNNNEQRNEFLKRSRELNHSLVFFLKTHYTQLSEADINLLVLILLRFTSKEISVLYNIEPASVKKKRNRLRKKMGLSIEESFEDFFDKVMEKLQLRGSA